MIGIAIGTLAASEKTEFTRKALTPTLLLIRTKWRKPGRVCLRRAQIWSVHQSSSRSQRRQEHLGVRPLRVNRMHELDDHAD